MKILPCDRNGRSVAPPTLQFKLAAKMGPLMRCLASRRQSRFAKGMTKGEYRDGMIP
jgi:hypothetical protein